jgi:hypothetical protein
LPQIASRCRYNHNMAPTMNGTKLPDAQHEMIK